VPTRVRDLHAGDEVKVAAGTARVVCVVRSTHPSNDLVRMGDLVITPRHPIRVDGTWTLPVGEPAAGSTVYNFVLDRCHVLMVNGVECVTLGHGLTEPGVAHQYYGSLILGDLAKLPGWSAGLVNVEFCLRDIDGHCIGLTSVADSDLIPLVVA